MRYMGGKSRLAKYLLPIVLKDRESDQPYYDICCGAGAMSTSTSTISIASPVTAVDINFYTIEAMKLIRDHPTALPKNNHEFTEEDYLFYKSLYKENRHHLLHPGIFGYIGYTGSFAGKWYDTWAKDTQVTRDFIAEGYRNAQKQSPCIQNVNYIAASFDSVEIQEESIVYIDPPYRDSTRYTHIKEPFPYAAFYEWCKYIKYDKKCKVFLSEYWTPFTPVWSKEVPRNISRKKTKKNKDILWVVL